MRIRYRLMRLTLSWLTSVLSVVSRRLCEAPMWWLLCIRLVPAVIMICRCSLELVSMRFSTVLAVLLVHMLVALIRPFLVLMKLRNRWAVLGMLALWF